MKNLYYDGELSKKINESFQNNAVLSEKMYKDYIELYKKDYSMKVQYVNNLIVLGKLDKASTLLEVVEEEYLSDNNYIGSKKDIDLFLNLLVVTKLKLYIYTKRYEEAYELMNEKPGSLRTVLGDYLAVELFLQKKLGLETREHIPNYYLYNQIIDYNYDKFIETTKKLHGFDTHSEGSSYFDSTFPIEKIAEEIKNFTPNNRRMNNGIIDNHYYFKYNKCGYNADELTDYFALLTYDDSRDFLIMFPTKEKERYPYIDLNYLRRDNLPPHKRVRRVSQMEKFKNRYGNI